MKVTFTSALLVSVAAAFPALLDPEVLARSEDIVARIARRQGIANDPLKISQSQTNCGPTPCLTFDEKDQEVSVTGEFAYRSPAPDEIRGLCPGLNAAANHGQVFSRV